MKMKMKLIRTWMTAVIIFSVLITANISMAAQESLNQDQEKTDDSQDQSWYQGTQDWATEKYNSFSGWANDKYQQHPEWKTWSDKIGKTTSKASDSVQDFFSNNSSNSSDGDGDSDSGSNNKQKNHLSVPTNSSQESVLNTIENDQQLDPLGSPVSPEDQQESTQDNIDD